MPSNPLSSPPSREMRANFYHLYADIGWFGLLGGSILSFLAIYAARLGANSFQVGLLSAGPAMVNMLLSLPSGHWLENRPLIRTSFLAALWSRLGYLLLIALPALFGNTLQIWGMVLLSLALSAPGTILNVSFNAMFAEVVPPEWRAHVIGRRNALSAVSVMLTSLACGQILDNVLFPLNYQIVFGLGWVGGVLSVYHLYRIRFGAQGAWRAGRPNQPFTWQALPDLSAGLRRPFLSSLGPLRLLARSGGKPLLRLDRLRGPFGLFMAVYLLFYTFQYVPISLFPIYNVHTLSLTDGEISLGSAIFQGMVTAMSLVLGRLSTRLSHRRQLILSALIFGQYPLLLYLAKNATLYWAASLTGGLIFAVLNGAMLNRLMERVPEGDRPAHMALHNLAFNLGILAGSLSGPALASLLGMRDAMLLSAGLRTLAGVVMIVWV